jgi:hypothetical protein
MVGGGDQIYCDAITREPELQGQQIFIAFYNGALM